MRVQMLAPAVLLIVSITPVMLLSQLAGAPETFTADLLAIGGKGGAASADLVINVQRYTPEADLYSSRDSPEVRWLSRVPGCSSKGPGGGHRRFQRSEVDDSMGT